MLSCALEILENNQIERAVFSDAIVKLLVMGRGKGHNIYISGPANCGKNIHFGSSPVNLQVISFSCNMFICLAGCGGQRNNIPERFQVLTNNSTLE